MPDKPIYLSKGTNGKVYITKDEKTGEIVVIKELIVRRD
jgi:hypothetical protein